MREFVELVQMHEWLLPLLGAFYIIQLFSNSERGVRIPAMLGVAVGLGSWAQTGTMVGAMQGLLFGLATFGAAVAAYGWQVRVSIRKWVSLRMWRGIGFGVLFGGVQLGIGLLFSYVVQRLGGSVDEGSVREIVEQSPWPWLIPVAVGVAAGVYEELVYRKLADVWLSRWMPGWAVVLVSSFLWACTHGTGDVSPWYLRLVELGLIVGPLSFGFYRRFGLFPTVIAHGFYNAAVVLISEIILA
ncbi:CPBP family intramembrane metalloprotease [Tumebacillus sp. ITR2]|uniref:CPBP family intramembrane metalloprotease n=1 Tax=Tumebacillus amylolyticus TaxID=2801339 RepID=A0ABS1JAX1_9BACL|nr:CPBP family intramembrane glutamic endopeptidase [Tumebacillus amylolyticus]MBL0387390.1 CPBP family intramembrane metalloprotease [Tumebacillus amylolyticus]